MKRSRKLIFPLFLLYLLFREASLIFDLIYEYPVKLFFDRIDWDNSISFLFVIIGFLLIWKQYRWIKDSYIMSNNQWLVYVFIMAFYVLARYGENWEFLKTDVDKRLVAWQWQSFFEQSSSWIYHVKLIDIIWLSIVYPLSAIIKSVFSKTYNRTYLWVARIYEPISKRYVESFKKESPQKGNDFFEEDIALRDSDEKRPIGDIESVQYHELTKVLVPKLVKQKFQKAFSIGIIGPYGNGKSSFVNHLRDQFENKLSSERFEIIEFLPAYSHKPEQISTDFFTILASRLKKYHGSLNQSMLTYAAKLIELGVNGKKDIQGLLKPTDWFTENKSASQAYLDLKDIFTQIDIKTIVIIDDVDRLGKDEIFEVFRIIRNTANFPNTIFIVAYDKDYVVDTIEKDIMYLDKYFQYELFVPPHRSEDLLKSFSEIVLRKETGLDAEQLKKLEKVINVEILNKTLLDKFVFNYRDVKVLTNIYCTNLCLLTEEIDFIDLLHFTIMNRHFPKQVRYIYNNFDEVFVATSARPKKLELKKSDSFKGVITVASFIGDLKIKDDSQKDLFKRLFLSLFGIKDEGQPKVEISSEDKYKNSTGYYDEHYKGVYSPDEEMSIRNAERTHLYFGLLIRKDEISNVQFPLKFGSSIDSFKLYINKLINDQEGDSKKNEMKKKIQTKLESFEKDFDNVDKIKNAIWACYEVRGGYFKNNLVDVLYRNIIINYPNALADIFGGDNDAFADLFKTNLWDNPDIGLEYKIATLLDLSKEVEYCISSHAHRFKGKLAYFGSSKEQIKEILIAQTKEYIKTVRFKYGSDLTCISNVLDSELGISDADIDFSDYLFNNHDRLFEYLDVVQQDYHESFKFSSVIFKVFTDKEKFEKECFDKFPKQEKLIREFHHLLELHSWRKDKVDGFIPFYFDDVKDLKNSLSEPVMQTIYIDLKEGELTEPITRVKNSEDIKIIKIKDSKCLLEGKHSYLTLIKEVMPSFSHKEVFDSLKANKDKFKILSIQTPDQIDKSIIPYSEFNNMVEELKEEEEPIEAVVL